MDTRTTHLYSYHKANSRLTVFAGFEMPLWYSSISDEHMAVRNGAGLFDVTHMGRIEIAGSDATKFLNFILPSNVTKVQDARDFYSTVCNEKGGIIDDTVTFRFDENRYIMVANAANREKDLRWLTEHSVRFEVVINDVSDTVAMFALQGPMAQFILQKTCHFPLSQLKRFTHIVTKVAGVECIVSRTGYTGEDGFEVMVPKCSLDEPTQAEEVWKTLLSEGKGDGLIPCGLGCRDTLRIEAGYCLYGQDIDESVAPFEADLGWLVSFDKDDYVGKDALLQAKGEVKRIRCGFLMEERAIPRPGCEILKSGTSVGRVTSGTFSPLLKRGIAMGYISSDISKPGSEVMIAVRGNLHGAKVSGFPLYDASTYGFKRTPSSQVSS